MNQPAISPVPPPARPATSAILDRPRGRRADDMTALSEVLDAGLSGRSPLVAAYEQALLRQFRAREAIAVSSGGAALQIALQVLGVKPGDEVVLAPTGPLCTLYPVMAAGARPVFCDIRPGSFSLDPADLERVITRRTRALIEVPMWGYPTPVGELRAVADVAQVPLILDLSHAHGTTWRGLDLSRYGTISCYSTHERKPLSTGEGGFILTDDADLARRCRLFSRFGDLDGVHLGVNYKLGALAAALGLSRLRLLKQDIEVSRSNARRVLAGLRSSSVWQFDVVTQGEPNYYSLLLRTAFRSTERFIRHLGEAGIPSDILRYRCICLYQFPVAAEFARPCPNAERTLSHITTIPVHPMVTEEQLEHIVTTINRYRE